MSKRAWLKIATAGVVLVVVPMILSVLVIADKERFGWFVGSTFLQVIASGVILGGIVLLVAAFKLPERKTWRGIVLIVWGLLALTSPAFGYMFLLPWGVLVLLLPAVIVALVTMFRGTASGPPAVSDPPAEAID